MKFNLKRKAGGVPANTSAGPPLVKKKTLATSKISQIGSDSESEDDQDQDAKFKAMIRKKSQKVAHEVESRESNPYLPEYDEESRKNEVSDEPQTGSKYIVQLKESNERRKKEQLAYKQNARDKELSKARENGFVFESEEYKKLQSVIPVVATEEEEDVPSRSEGFEFGDKILEMKERKSGVQDKPGSHHSKVYDNKAIRPEKIKGSESSISPASKRYEPKISIARSKPDKNNEFSTNVEVEQVSGYTGDVKRLQGLVSSRVTQDDLAEYTRRYWERMASTGNPEQIQ